MSTADSNRSELFGGYAVADEEADGSGKATSGASSQAEIADAKASDGGHTNSPAKSDAPSVWKRLSRGLSTLGKGVKVAIVVAAFGLVVLLVLRQLRAAPDLHIEPLSVAPALESRGYSSKVVTGRLYDALRRAIDEAKTTRRALEMPELGPVLDIKDPVVGWTAAQWVAGLRQAFGIAVPAIAGDLVCTTEACAEAGMALRLRVSDGADVEIIETAARADRTLDSLFDEGARQALRHMEPHLVAQLLVQDPATREQARAIAREMIREQHPETPWAALLLGNAEMLDDQAQSSLKWYSRAQDYATAQGLSGFSHPVQNAGMALQKLGRLDEAEAAYRRATQIAPDDFNAWWGLANVLHDKGLAEDSLAPFAKAAELAPAEEGIRINWAIALYDVGRYEEAVDKLDLITDLDPDNADAWNNKGNALYRIGQPEAAEAAYLRATALAPQDPSGWFNLGDLRYEQGRLDESEALLVKAMQLGPELPNAPTRLADLMGERREYDAAIALYRETATAHPDYPHVWSNWEATLALMIDEASTEVEICRIAGTNGAEYLGFAGKKASTDARKYFGDLADTCSAAGISE